MLDNASNQPSKFRTKNWVEINDESTGGYNVNSQIKFKTKMLKSSLCDYSYAYILVNTEVDNAKDVDIVMPMYNLIEYIAIIIQKHLEAYGNIVKIYQL